MSFAIQAEGLLADRISVIDHGRRVADGRADELKRRVGGQTLQVRPTDLANVPAAVARSSPLIGAVLGDIVRYLVSLAVLLVFATIMGFRIQTDPLSALAAILVVIAFALAMC